MGGGGRRLVRIGWHHGKRGAGVVPCCPPRPSLQAMGGVGVCPPCPCCACKGVPTWGLVMLDLARSAGAVLLCTRGSDQRRLVRLAPTCSSQWRGAPPPLHTNREASHAVLFVSLQTAGWRASVYGSRTPRERPRVVEVSTVVDSVIGLRKYLAVRYENVVMHDETDTALYAKT